MACREVEHDTPLGSYAVEYLQYTLDDSARNYSEITVTISYRCTAQQMASIAHVTNTSALRDLLAQAQEEGLTELVGQFSSTDRGGKLRRRSRLAGALLSESGQRGSGGDPAGTLSGQHPRKTKKQKMQG